MKLINKTAIVTGASQGIGAAIAQRLAEAGAEVFMLGRSKDRLQSAGERIEAHVPLQYLQADLADSGDTLRAAARFSEQRDELHILVNCGGIYAGGTWNDSSVDGFQQVLLTNVCGPTALTQALLPQLARAHGSVIFINSSVVKGDGAGAGEFAASQHALKAVADSLRAEVNPLGIRVTSIYPGRTATPRQEAISRAAGRSYRPERLLQPTDIAAVVMTCLMQADTAEITDLHIRQRHKN